MVSDVGGAIVGAGKGIAPADKRLYAIRDLTGTVESVDLITSSILSKKLAAGLEALILDVKVGSGAFMQDIDGARQLARSLVSVANGTGCRTSALLTDMNQSLAFSAGNALEVKSALAVLKNEPGEERLLEVTLALGSNLLVNAGIFSDEDTAKESLEESLSSGKAAEIFGHMIGVLGGPIDFVEKTDEYLPVAENILDFPSPCAGDLKSVNGRILGQTVIELGGGRKQPDDKLDLSVGLDQFIRIGKNVEQGDPILRIHSSNDRDMERAKNLLSEAFQFSENPVESNSLIMESITHEL